jgi:hypothetical protein
LTLTFFSLIGDNSEGIQKPILYNLGWSFL